MKPQDSSSESIWPKTETQARNIKTKLANVLNWTETGDMKPKWNINQQKIQNSQLGSDFFTHGS